MIFDFSMQKLIPAAVLGIGTLAGVIAQALPETPVATGVGELGQVSAVGALIWILIRTLPAAFSQISEDRKSDREERRADRDAYRTELAEIRNAFVCQQQKRGE